MKKRNLIISLMLILVLMLGITTGYAASANFSDVKSTNWAYSYITNLVERGGISGYPDGTFKANNTITAAEFIKITVALVDGVKVPTGKHWASGYMQAAADMKIIPEGMIEEADWNKAISRQKLAVIMERTAQLVNEEEVVTDTAKLENIKSGIKDYDKICNYCKDYVVQAVLRGLITGYTDGTFGPEKTATRAEASAMIIRLIDQSKRVFPATEKNLDELISNKETMEDLKGVTIYLYDPNVAKYEVSYEIIKGTTFLRIKDMYVLGLIKDGKIIEQAVTIPTNTEGNRSTTVKTDVTTVDYILSCDNATGDVIVIPNPLKK